MPLSLLPNIYLLVGPMLLHELVGGLDPKARDIGQIITASQQAHIQKLNQGKQGRRSAWCICECENKSRGREGGCVCKYEKPFFAGPLKLEEL